MVSGRLFFKLDKMVDSLIWLLDVRYLYTRRGHIIGELNGEQEQSWKALKNKK